jgi:alpha-beta hydrolase superfamily lysophospholipase
MKTGTFLSPTDQAEITYYTWQATDEPQGVVCIAHGLGEHALRYARFAKALNQQGFHVLALDHRGHGATKLPGKDHGDFGQGLWDGLCDDITALLDLAAAQYSALPIVLFGHSMGSFAAQQVAMGNSNKFCALILSGSSSNDKLLEEMMAAGPDAIGFAYFNRSFEPRRTDFDWLSRDEKEVDKYIEDPLCGFELNDPSRESMIQASFKMADPARIDLIRKDLPVLLVSGDKDPVGGDLAYLQVLEDRWRQAGIISIDTQYYPDGRHEMLNEVNRDEVTTALIHWIKSKLPHARPPALNP